MTAALIAYGAISPLGSGHAAFATGSLGSSPRIAVATDPVLQAAGLARPISARSSLPADATHRAERLLLEALDPCLVALSTALPRWRNLRVGLALGTSSGPMDNAAVCFERLERGGVGREWARSSTYFAPFASCLARLGAEPVRATQILGACASSTLAIGIGLRWLELAICDVVLCGGYDALSLFVAAGFEALRATTSSSPSPFRQARDGLCLGEGAAVVAMVPAHAAPNFIGGNPCVYVRGFGASTDAIHITAPDRDGGGMQLAARRALEDAQLDVSSIGLVSAHGTATSFNDAAEATALAALFAGVDAPLVHAFKGQIGHTLGAAGALETLAAADALLRQRGPASAGDGPVDPACDVHLLGHVEQRVTTNALKLSAAFGGANAALVLSTRPGPRRARPARIVRLLGFTVVHQPLPWLELARLLSISDSRLSRLDGLSRLLLSALGALSEQLGPFGGDHTGLIVGHTLATWDTNEAFDARRRSHGARAVHPRSFPATSPNVSAGEAAISFQLRGPTFSVGGGLHGGVEALQLARELVEAGDARRMLVGSVDAVGESARALLREAEWPLLQEGACVALMTSEELDGPEIRSQLAASRGLSLFGHQELAATLACLKPPLLR